jgi:LytS/YehU family sensor histidine kinase
LFNSLNSIRALIDLEPVKAKQSVTTLSNLLRNSLVLGKNEFITLQEELQIVKSYLELEKIRFEERLEVFWEIDESLNEILVPPFILQTQAENAIKHGISKIVEGGKIVISTKKVNEYWIELTILNSGELGYQVDTGIGIENSKRRLDLQYNGNTLFELFQNKDEVVCSIKIKL